MIKILFKVTSKISIETTDLLFYCGGNGYISVNQYASNNTSILTTRRTLLPPPLPLICKTSPQINRWLQLIVTSQHRLAVTWRHCVKSPSYLLLFVFRFSLSGCPIAAMGKMKNSSQKQGNNHLLINYVQKSIWFQCHGIRWNF